MTLRLRIGMVVAGLLLLAVLVVQGLVVVAPGEQVVVRRFGRFLPQAWAAGPHWAWPLGIDRIDRVRTDEVRRLEVGRTTPAGPSDDPSAGEFLTGDRNLLLARAVVQYRVANPRAFVTRAPDPESLLTRLVEAALAQGLARQGIDASLERDRIAVSDHVRDDVAASARRLGLGVHLLAVHLIELRPPVEVQPDFNAAQAARSERDRRSNEARTEQAKSRTMARAAAAARLNRARAEADRTVTLARVRAARFLGLLTEVRRGRDLTVQTLYCDALRDLLPRVRRKLVLAGDSPIDLSVFGTSPGASPSPKPRASRPVP